MKTLRDDDKTLIKALQFCFNPELLPDLLKLNETDWVELAENAIQHGVNPFLWHHLKSVEDSLLIPEEVRARFTKAFLFSAGKGIVVRNQLSTLLALFHDNQIWNVVLKGAYLADKIYRDFSIRPMTDIDILIDQEDAIHLEDILSQNGYIPLNSAKLPISSPHFTYFPTSGGIELEVHISLLPLRNSDRFDITALRERSVKTELVGCRTNALVLEDMVLYHCYHLCRHLLLHFGLRSVCDIAMLIRSAESGINWLTVADRAEKWDCVHSVILSIELVKSLLQVSVSEEYDQAFNRKVKEPFDIETAYSQIFNGKRLSRASKEDVKSICKFISNIRNRRDISIIINTIFPSKSVISRLDVKSGKSKGLVFKYIKNTLRQIHKVIRIISIFIFYDSEKIRNIRSLNKLNNWLKL